MSDKVQKIRQEIERRIKEDSSKNDISEGALALNSLLDFIDSLPEEPASEDLEEEIGYYTTSKLLKKRDHSTGVYHLTQRDCDDIARHFAEWQREKDIKLEKIEDLEEFAQKWAYSNYHKELDGVNCDCLYSGVKKGAEWQKNQMKETLQTEYEKGRFDMREEMMKDTVETTIVNDWQYGKDPDYAIIPAIHQRIKEFTVGDKVKIIICKPEQQ